MPEARKLVLALMEWFERNARPLPWRRTTDPYAIWISEIMLQQTQAQTVIPYWERWIKRWPAIAELAEARFDEVLKLWEGLGYYRRARNVLQAARILVEQYDGKLPRTYDEVLSLPGVGRYTAGAICSIAFNQPTAILDGNVVRVLARQFGVGGRIGSERTKKRLWKLAQELVDAAGNQASRGRRRCCSALNQGLMELGAMICLPKNPLCSKCPVVRSCVAHQTGRTAALPNTGNRPKMKSRSFAAFVGDWKGRFLVRRRPGGEVNGWLWEFPNIETTGDEAHIAKLARICLGRVPDSIEPLCTIRHSITRFRMQLVCYVAVMRGDGPPGPPGTRWCNLKELDALAFPSAHRKVLRALESRCRLQSPGNGGGNLLSKGSPEDNPLITRS